MREFIKTLGVIGGMGPLATALFLELVIRNTAAKTDQEHLDIIMYNIPRIPDRTGYILGESRQSPLPALKEYAKKLEAGGAGVIAIPCVTSSYFLDELAREIKTELINPITLTVKELLDNNVKKAGIMATSGTLATKLFRREMENADIEYIEPSPECQHRIMDIIYRGVKAGGNISPNKLIKEADLFFEQGCDAVVLGCTELSIIKNNGVFDSRYYDVLEILAKGSIKACGKFVVNG